MIGIYMFENKDNHKKYIGQSINITKRKWQHIYSPSPYSKFDDILHKEGINNFNFSIIETCTVDKLDEKEKYWISYYNSIQDGYNLIEGGNCYRGQKNIQAKLNNKQVLQIIDLLANTTLSYKEIANKYKVSYNTIDLINRCKTWCHLHNFTSNIRQTSLNNKECPHSTHAGEYNKSCKITELQALKIIDLLKYDNRSLAQLSRELDISLNILYDINRCRTWKHLHNYRKNVRREARKEVVPI